MNIYEIEFKKHWLTKQWRWRVVADNGNIIGASTESYWNKQDCIDNAKTLGKHLSANFSTDESK